jgi:polyvinyl alcohol dehydrogenase (cytochrome)
MVYQGKVYIGMASFGDCPTVQGQIFQLDAATGNILHIFSVIPDGCTGGGVWSSPVIDPQSGALYISTGNADTCPLSVGYSSSMLELRAADLSLVDFWKVPGPDCVIDCDFGAAPTLFTAPMGGSGRSMVGVAHKNGLYYAFIRDAMSDGPIWIASIAVGGSDPEQGEGSISPSAWDGTRLYVAGGNTYINGNFCSGSVRALDPATGNFLWEHCLTNGPVLAPVTVVPGLVIVEEGTTVDVINATSGKTLFTYTDSNDGSVFNGAASVSNGVLYVGNFDGNLYAFGLQEKTQPAWIKGQDVQ